MYEYLRRSGVHGMQTALPYSQLVRAAAARASVVCGRRIVAGVFVSSFQDRLKPCVDIDVRRVGLGGPGKLTSDIGIQGRELGIFAASHRGHPAFRGLLSPVAMPITSSLSGCCARASGETGPSLL